MGLQGIGTFAIEALEHALSFAAGRQRQDQKGPAAGARRSFGLAHGNNFANGPNSRQSQNHNATKLNNAGGVGLGPDIAIPR
jgi:hypothetical protein